VQSPHRRTPVGALPFPGSAARPLPRRPPVPARDDRAMEFQDVVRRRRMVRTYTQAPVDRAAVDRMLANAVRAPSAGFSQGWGFLVLDTPADVELFWATTAPGGPPSRWLRAMRAAPVVVVPHADADAYRDRYAQPDKQRPDDERGGVPWAVPYWWVDAGMATLLVLQTAVDEGLGACFFGIPAERTAAYRAAFGVPEHLEPVGAVPRRRAEDVVHRGRWGAPG
jgi:nitroreductase